MAMDWKSAIMGFRAYLILERSLSENSVEAYLRDIRKLAQFLSLNESKKGPLELVHEDLSQFIRYIYELGLGERSQARILSGIKAFYKYLLIENQIDKDPTDLMQGPKLGRKIPAVLSVDEIELMFSAIDLSGPQGHRNRAMLETLYACGLRVSELINLKISEFYPDVEYIKVTGKGDKERIVPMGAEAVRQNLYYMEHYRNHQVIKPGQEDFLYLNRRGNALSRVMVFTIIKNQKSCRESRHRKEG